MKDKELLKLLIKNGWTEKRITGSHHIVEKGDVTIAVPVHGKDMKKGLEAAILKTANLSGGKK
jgi:predicted RNA binding protein YcfA (HicA-like mRNA interferase family)